MLRYPVPLLLLASLLACAQQGTIRDRNIVLITMDTTRADRIGCYGYDKVSTPNIDQIARQGTLFTRAFATAPITGPSHASILSGTYPPYHRVHDNSVTSVPPEIPWIPEILDARGFTTAGFIAAYPVRGVFGFGRGFDYFSDTLAAPPGSVIITNLHTVGVASRKGEKISAEFEKWLERRPKGPFFAWLHYYDPHWPWEAGAGYADIYEDSYDGEIAYMDDCIGTVISALERAGVRETTGVVLVADHGEGLMDHGELTHALLAYNSTIRVPLIMNFPWLQHRPQVTTTVSTVDVAPTILDALAIDQDAIDPAIQGRSLRAVLEADGEDGGEAAEERALYFETFYPYFHYGWGILTGVVEGRWKYIKGPDDELFDIESDFAEQKPIDDPKIKEHFSNRLSEITAGLAEGRPERASSKLDREAREMLRSLGYVGEIAETSLGEVPNLEELPIPRENMAAFFQYNNMLSQIHAKNIPQAARLCRDIVERNPTQKDARLLQVNLAVMLGNIDEAARLFEKVLEDFHDPDVLFQAGLFYLGHERHDEANRCLEQVVAMDPTDYEALAALGASHAKTGDADSAREHYEAALTVNPKHRRALLELAVLLDRAGDEGSRAYFEKAVRMYPFDPDIAFNYGVFLFRSGDDKNGLEHLRRASTMADGDVFEPAHLALASYYEGQGDTEMARRYLREVILKTQRPDYLSQARTRLEQLQESIP